MNKHLSAEELRALDAGASLKRIVAAKKGWETRRARAEQLVAAQTEAAERGLQYYQDCNCSPMRSRFIRG